MSHNHNNDFSLPAGWHFSKLKNIGVFAASGIDKKSNDDEVPVRMVNYTDVYGNLSREIRAEMDLMKTTCAPEKAVEYLLFKGDLLFTPSSETSEDIGLSALVAEDLENTVFSYHILRFRFNKEVDFQFKKYLCNNTFVLEQFSEKSKGTTRQILSRDDFNSTIVVIPPLQTQIKIADYLDRKTAELDQLIGAKQRLLKLLDEKKRALIARAVTRGLNPDVPLKESGIPWLGMIPTHWQLKRITTLFKERDERGRPELPLLVVSIHSGVTLREFSNDKIEQQATDFNTYKVALKGDISFNKMRMWQGAVGCVPCDGLVSPDYVVAEPCENISTDYYGMLFKTPMFSDESACRSHGIVWDRLRLYWDEFKDISVPVPPFAEQKNIVVEVNSQQDKLNKLKSITENTLTLLQERRTALISAAVTGKLCDEILNAGISTQTKEPLPNQAGEHHPCLI